MNDREREIARLGLVYGAKGWEPLRPGHKPGVIDPVGSIILEVDGTHPIPAATTRAERERALVRMTTARTASFFERHKEDMVALHIAGNGMEELLAELDRTHPMPAPSESADGIECHGLDTPERVRFYEHDFYPLSNFSAFSINWGGLRFDTSEHVYHYEKFHSFDDKVAKLIAEAPSAHVAFKLAEQLKLHRRPEWDRVKVGVMRNILYAKIEQHEYVKRKLLATGDRELVEDSWRDDFWGWGPHRDGQNMLGKLWMELRAELRGGAR